MQKEEIQTKENNLPGGNPFIVQSNSNWEKTPNSSSKSFRDTEHTHKIMFMQWLLELKFQIDYPQ